MKLATDLPLRKDQTVTATVDGAVYTFKPDASGQTVADVANDEHVGYLLDTGNFYPADEKDIRAGVDAVKSRQEVDPPADDPAPQAVAKEPAPKASAKAKK